MKFEVETASLNATVKNINSELSEIIDKSNRLYEALEELDSMWVGTAHDTFSAQYKADQQILGETCKKISAVSEGLDAARKTYEQCEQSVEAEIRKIVI